MAGRVPLSRVAGLAAIVAGIAIAVSPFAFSLVGNADGGERITNRFRFTLSNQGLAQLKSSYTTAVGMGNQFFTQMLPDVQRAARQSPSTFEADLRKRYPAIADAEKNVPPVVAIVNPQVPGLLGLHDDFKKVDSLPFLGLPISSIPWLLLGLGVGVAALGLAVFARPGRAGAALVAIAGLGLVAVPLIASAPSKADAAVRVERAGRFVFSPKIGPAALATTERIDALVHEVETSFIPQTAAQSHETAAQFTAKVAQRYPAVARGLTAWPSIKPGALHRARDQVASQRDFANLEGIHLRALPWAVIGPGILMLLFGTVALVQGRKTSA
ncbi:MAG: hypothetical protein QOK25_1092 [Thermoleophilaceae bacterium]|jgi:hypothetical protein|nr:hypothetical protein [Thermoleophilaceae bacterium]